MSDKDVPPRFSPYLRPVPPAADLARSTAAFLLGAGIVVVALLTALGANGLGEYLQLRQQRDHLRQQEAALLEQAAALEGRLQALRTEPFALEKLARERYNMRRPGEQIILLVPDPAAR
jgi:cell division protein FtsB